MRWVDYPEQIYLEIAMGILLCHPKCDKKEPKFTIFFGETFRFDVWVRLNDQYKIECGP